MKKQLLALALLTAGLATAQPWTENFNSAVPPGLPVGWTQINVDGATTSTNAVIAGFSFGANAGVTRNITTAFSYPATYSVSLITTSAYQTPGTSNDWIISPSFVVPPNAVFNWEARSADAVQLNSYEIRVSTTGTTVSSFTNNPILYNAAPEAYISGTFNPHGVSLNTYSNQTIYLAIHEKSNDQWNAYYDNFNVSVPALSTDGSIVNVTGLTRYMVGAGVQTITGTFKELGYSNATTAVLNYKVNNGAVTTQTMTFAPVVPYYGTSAYTFSAPANLGLGTNNVKVWVSAVNGSNETNFANDTATSLVYVCSQSVAINALIEQWTSSTCPPCAAANVSWDPLLSTNNVNLAGSKLNVIKYQVNWPSPGNDPSYNPDVATKVSWYAISAAPTYKGNGASMSNSQGGIDAAKAMPAYANIASNISISGNVVSASSTITPFVTISSASPIRVHQALLQKYYDYPGASTSQKTYHHAMRKMFPSASGVVVSVADGVPQTASFTHTIATVALPSAQGTNNFWTTTVTPVYEYVVWIQDEVTKQILQSSSSFVALGSVGVVELKNNSNIGVYPNPAKDFAVIGIRMNNPSAVEINIFDVTGKVVYTNKAEVAEGDSEIKINTSEFATGTYNVVVNTKDGPLKEKLIIVK